MRLYLLRLSLAAVILLYVTAGHSQQIINAYAEVVSVSGSTLNLGTVDETFDSFEAGGKIVVIQMQDDVVSDLSNTSGFGDIAAITSAGSFEILTISSVQESGGEPQSITVSNSLVNTYSFNDHSSVQIVSYPNPGGAVSYTTTTDITAKHWDGTTGGVLAFYVDEKLVLEHDINVDGKGFRGGDEYETTTSADCNESNYVMPYTNAGYAGKGEGIYNPADDNYRAGRGKLANGGGGGNAHNSGGGGGGNYTAGGSGLPGWQCSNNGGVGGESLGSFFTSGRLFAGGGGGGGEANDGYGTNGGDGGGIIIIEADTLITSASTDITISANGESVDPTSGDGNDGAGGGGAGGSILLKVNHFKISSTAPLSVQANGGKGGDVAHNDTHGAGGGGGQGAVIYVVHEPADVNTQTTAGDGGAGNESASAPVASSGTGTENDGVIDDMDYTVFPVQWISYNAVRKKRFNLIEWTTATEINNSHFELYFSNGKHDWQMLGTVNGSGNSNELKSYSMQHDVSENIIIYYKIRQVDYDGKYSETPVFSVNDGYDSEMLVYPSPAQDVLHVTFNSEVSGKAVVRSNHGQQIFSKPILREDRLLLDVSTLPAGIYYLIIFDNEQKTAMINKWVKL